MNNVAGQQTQVFEIGELLALLEEGAIRIPKFQRRFRWNRDDAIRLFDSILKGYPVGSLLMWRRPAEAEVVVFSGVEVDAPELNDALWVIDGQQRITSLANALLDSSKDSDFSLVFNLQNRSVTAPGKVTEYEVPLSVMFNTASTLKWLREHPEQLDYSDVLTAAIDKIRRYKIPAAVVLGDDESVLREIFDRLNNFGKRLKRAEVFEALHQHSAPGEVSVRAISERINQQTGFGEIEDATILQCVLAQRGYDVHREVRDEFADENSLMQAYGDAERSLLHAVRFLQDNAGVPHVKFLPYSYLIVVLCRVFGVAGPIPDEDLNRLKTWFWRAAVTGPRGGNHASVSRGLCKAVVEEDIKQTMVNLLDESFELRRNILAELIDTFRANTAKSKLAACLYWQMCPRDPLASTVYTGSELSDQLADASLKDIFVDVVQSRELSGNFAHSLTRKILAFDPDGLKIEDLKLASVSDEVLDSHALPPLGELDVESKVSLESYFDRRDSLIRDHFWRLLQKGTASQEDGTAWRDVSTLIIEDELDHA